MQHLDDQTLIKIFSHLYENDLLALTQTCHRFNRIISTTTKLLSNFTITLDKNHSNLKFFGSRKYQKVIWNAKKNFNEIFDKIGSSVRELRVVKVNEIGRFIEVFKKCPNLRNLYIDAVNADPKSEIDGIEELSGDLEELTINQGLDFIEIFKNFQISRLNLKHSISMRKIEELQKFLVSQKNLESLFLIMPPTLFMILFRNFEYEKIEFKLKKFGAIYMNNFTLVSEIFHKHFLDHHRETLESLESRDARLYNDLKYFKNLRSLTLSMIDNADLVKLVKIEKLKIEIRRGGSWAWNFPNVKKLEIKALPYLLDESRFLEKLEEISVDFYDGWHQNQHTFTTFLDLPRVTKIKVLNFKPKKVFYAGSHFGLTYVTVKSPFERNFLKLDTLTLNNCKDFKFLIEILRNQRTRMKSLVIEGGKLKKRQRKEIHRAVTSESHGEGEGSGCFQGLWDFHAFMV